MSDFRKVTTLPKKRVAVKILTAYEGGVASISEGVEYTAFGRDREVLKFDETLKMTREGSGAMQGYVGPYGVGKSFILALFQNLAIRKDFVVMSADITRDNWFAGTRSEKQGLALYRKLFENTVIKGKGSPAFDTILEKWYYELYDKTGGNIQDICTEFSRQTRDCNHLPMYDDIRAAICTRFREIDEDVPYRASVGFFNATMTLKTEAKAIGARDYIHESKWFDVMNTWAHLFVKAGYKGLILLVDQVDYLTNLPKQNRQQNYEFLLSMWNAVNEGRTEYLSVCMFAADKLIDDENKGIPMYPALDDRFRGCTELKILPTDNLVALMFRLKQIHELVHGWESNITEDDAKKFVEEMLENTSFSGNCIRPISMAWIKKLNDMQMDIYEDPSKYLEIAKVEVESHEDHESLESIEFPDE